MNAIPDHYAALGIDPSADQEVIAAAYRALAKKYHPDTGATTGTASAERFDQVQRAYEVLRTPESRRQYDLELLAQAERDLEAHLARKRRALPGAAASYSSAPQPDLGAIRPEPAGAAAQARKPQPQAAAARRPVAPFLIPVVLLLVLLGGAAWLFLPKPPDAPPKPLAESATPAQPPQETAATKPVFGSTSAESGAVAGDEPPQTAAKGDVEASPAAEPAAPVPTPTAAEGTAVEDVEKPVFGSTASAPVEAEAQGEAGARETAAVAPVPTPKLRPVKPKAAPAAKPAPVQRAEKAGAYTLIIYERRRRGRIRTHEADMLFASRGSCIEFGVQAVLRRMGARDINPRKPRIWYECLPAS